MLALELGLALGLQRELERGPPLGLEPELVLAPAPPPGTALVLAPDRGWRIPCFWVVPGIEPGACYCC